MGLRTTLSHLLSASAAPLLERAIQELVDDVLTARSLVGRSDLDALAADMKGLQRDLAQRHADLEALRQAIDAFHVELPDDLVDDTEDDLLASLDRATQDRDDLQRRIARLGGALDATADQITTLASGIDAVRARAEQAHQVATTARATAEAAADGVAELESRTP